MPPLLGVIRMQLEGVLVTPALKLLFRKPEDVIATASLLLSFAQGMCPGISSAETLSRLYDRCIQIYQDKPLETSP